MLRFLTHERLRSVLGEIIVNELDKIESRKNSDLEKYNRKVFKMLVLPKRPRKILYESISSGISEYAEKHPLVTYDELVQQFGSPKELVEAYIKTSNYVEMNQSQKRKMLILKVLLCIGIAIASILFTWVILDLKSKMEFTDGLYVETVYSCDEDPSSLPVFHGKEW